MNEGQKPNKYLTEAEVNASPFYEWLKRRFGGVVAARIIRETADYTADVLDRNRENHNASGE